MSQIFILLTRIKKVLKNVIISLHKKKIKAYDHLKLGFFFFWAHGPTAYLL